MKIASSSRLFGRQSLHEGLDLLKHLGYEGVEIWYEQLIGAPKRSLAQIRNSGLSVYLHAATWDLNLTSINPNIAKTSLDEVSRSIDLADDLGATTVVVHPGRKSSSKDDPLAYWDRQVEILKFLARYAAKSKVSLAIENMEARARELVVYPKDILRLLKACPQEELGLCLDIAHAATTGNIDAFLKSRLLERVIHLHVSNSTEGQTHTPLWVGMSHVKDGFKSFLTYFEGALVIEGYNPKVDPALVLERNMQKIGEWGL